MGVYLSTPKTEKVSKDGYNDRLRFGLSSMQGWRSSMEDAHAAYPDLDSSTSFFGVYDGHGGKAAAKFCAKFLHQQVLKHEAYSVGDLGTSLQKAFLRMDEMMCEQKYWRELAMAEDKMDGFSDTLERLTCSSESRDFDSHTEDQPSEKGPETDNCCTPSGTTACVALIQNNQLFVANAGDSRCVISRKGQAVNMSEDHKPYLESEKERIYKAGGYIQCGRVNGSLNLARAIGDMELKQNKSLPAEDQILTANPDIKVVRIVTLRSQI